VVKDIVRNVANWSLMHAGQRDLRGGRLSGIYEIGWSLEEKMPKLGAGDKVIVASAPMNYDCPLRNYLVGKGGVVYGADGRDEVDVAIDRVVYSIWTKRLRKATQEESRVIQFIIDVEGVATSVHPSPREITE
jgi:hypothetical protein